jgi:hypothetical protein
MLKNAVSAIALLGFVSVGPAYAFDTGVTGYHAVSGSSAGTTGEVAGLAASGPGGSEFATSKSGAFAIGQNQGYPGGNMSTAFSTQWGHGFTTGTGLGVAAYDAGSQSGAWGVTSFTKVGFEHGRVG